MGFEEVIDDVRDAVGDKGFLILIIGIVAIFILMLSKQSQEGQDESTMIVGLTSYPDAVTNANVIIDTIQDNIEYSEDNILDAIEGQGEQIGEGFDAVNENISVNFEATNDYINKGFEAQTDLIDKVGSDIIGDISDVSATLGTVKNDVTNIKTNVQTITTNTTATAKKNTATTSTPKKTTSSKKAETSYYTYKTKKGLNTNKSIVDALKAIGVDSSMGNRKKIAKANGISNYTGTYKQNVQLLGKLKSGKLKKV